MEAGNELKELIDGFVQRDYTMMPSASVDPDLYVHVLDPEHGPQDELRTICKSGIQEEAFYVCDVDTVVAKYQLWKRLLPRVRPHYSVKCNSSRCILSTLAALGADFDCASKMEIDAVLRLGVDSSRIIFAHPAKPATHIRYAARAGVNVTAFDSEMELYKMKTLHPNSRLLLRIRSDHDSAASRLGAKFGCDAAKEAPRLLRVAKSLGLHVVGVSFHVGSGCSDPTAFRGAIEQAGGVFALGRQLGFTFTLLDIGGGYPGDDDIAFAKIAQVINEALDDFFPSNEVTFISEPGCFFAFAAFTLAANVHSSREIVNARGDITNVMYFINDGVFGSFMGVLYKGTVCKARNKGEPLEAPRDSRLLPSTVWGPTCDGYDKVEAGAQLPRLEVGAWLVYRNMGAYTFALASTFNGFPVAKVHAVMSRSTWLQLRETSSFNGINFVPSATSRIGRLQVLPINAHCSAQGASYEA